MQRLSDSPLENVENLLIEDISHQLDPFEHGLIIRDAIADIWASGGNRLLIFGCLGFHAELRGTMEPAGYGKFVDLIRQSKPRKRPRCELLIGRYRIDCSEQNPQLFRV